MLTFLEKNSKDRSRARLGAIAGGAKTSAVAAAEAVLDSVPASGTMSQHEVNEVSVKESAHRILEIRTVQMCVYMSIEIVLSKS